ncbi:unnamed protein product [Caenorhabditis sp. 36 PRJEB53466]|nr:unnamed protein product [Caenorhabditis sp. 36 PRJEB53466]
MEPQEETIYSSSACEHEMIPLQDHSSPRGIGNGTGVGSSVPMALAMNGMNGIVKTRRKLMIEDPDISNALYIIVCQFPNCRRLYNWRVKFGKLRLLDHALTHSTTRISCKICGYNALNVRRMRSHYAREHPTERAHGYGIKMLIRGDPNGENDGIQMDENELKELWETCYRPWINLVGEASGVREGEQPRRAPQKKRVAKEAPEPETAKRTRSFSKRSSNTFG